MARSAFVPLFHVEGPGACHRLALFLRRRVAPLYELAAENVIPSRSGAAPRRGDPMLCATCGGPFHPQWLTERIPILGGAGNFGLNYGSSGQTITCTFGNNPTGTINQHGRISAAILNNGSPPFTNVLVQGKLKTGGSSPTGNKQYLVYALASADGGTTYTDGFSIGDADSAVLVNTAPLLVPVPVAAATTTYYFGPIGLAGCFGDLPDHWGLYVFNDSGQTPSTTNADHAFWYQGVYGQYT